MEKRYTITLTVLFVILLIFLKCQYFSKMNHSIIASNEIDTIPFKYDTFGRMITDVHLGNDTLDFIIDTGANNSLINSALIKSEDLKSKKEVNQKATDALGHTKKIKKFIIKKMDIGTIKIKNYPVFVYDKTKMNLLGNNLLSQFCVKFDNEYQRVILSKHSNLIPKKGIKIPLLQKGHLFYIPIILSKSTEPIYFLLDTGYETEFFLDNDTYQVLKLPESKQQKWISPRGYTLFSFGDSYAKDSTVVYSFADFKIGNKLFKNIVVNNPNIKKSGNLVGSVFLSRFRSFTVDYPNKTLYLELPKDYSDTQYNVNMTFSKDTITDVPVDYFHMLYHKINSLGINILYDHSPYRVESFTIKYKGKINIGDTLVGVDDKIFYKDIYDKYITKKSDFKVFDDVEKQQNLLFKVLSREISADFYFLKNQKLIKLTATRDTLLNPPPQIAYSCYPTKGRFPYFALSSTITEKDGRTFAIHYPWSTLTGREIEIETYYDKEGKKQVFTNKPK